MRACAGNRTGVLGLRAALYRSRPAGVGATLVRWYYWPDGSLRASVTFRRRLTLSELASPFGGVGDVPFWFNFEQTRRPEELRPVPAAAG